MYIIRNNYTINGNVRLTVVAGRGYFSPHSTYHEPKVCAQLYNNNIIQWCTR